MTTAAISSSAQGSGVRTEYMKDNKSTRVETNMLYLINTPEQFLELQLRSWFKGSTISAPAREVAVEIYSFSKKPLFKKEADREIVAITDSGESKVGTLSVKSYKGDPNNKDEGGFLVYGLMGNPNVAMHIPVPSGALVKGGGNVNALTMEMMSLSMKPDDFLKVAGSTKLELKIGNTLIPLNDRQVAIVRSFAEQITPK